MFIYAEFEIINTFFKERRSKYKPAYALNTQHFQKCSCLYRDFSLVVEIWFKVLEIHRSKCVRTLLIVPPYDLSGQMCTYLREPLLYPSSGPVGVSSEP